MEQKLSLFELNERIRETLQDTFSSLVWVVAEISELKENRNGHCYLELIEKSGNEIIARNRATIWSYTFRMLKPYFETTTGQMLNAGIKILVQVGVEYHPSFGLTLNIRDIDPVYTVGDMAVQRKQILLRLENEGVLNMNKELELPVVPQKIAIISSKTAAGYEDFVNQLQNNEKGFHFYFRLFEAFMQGAEAVPSIIRALEKVYRYEDFFDVVVIIRGGGGAADLNCFDNYELALNITQFPLPVLTGIGHEKDDTIADMVAHTRLKTPTAVAEFLIRETAKFYDKLIEIQDYSVSVTRDALELFGDQLMEITTGFSSGVERYLSYKNQALGRKGMAFEQKIRNYSFHREFEVNAKIHRLKTACSIWKLESLQQTGMLQKLLSRAVKNVFSETEKSLKAVKNGMKLSVSGLLQGEDERTKLNEEKIRILDPLNVLNRGYSITYYRGKPVKSVSDIDIGEEVETTVADGSFGSKITVKKNNNDQKNDV